MIHNRSFVISGFTTPAGYLTNKETTFLIASTLLRDRELYFTAECSAKDTAGFVQNMYKTFLSIQISGRP